MAKNVQVPGLGVVEFPDSMTDDQILDKVRAMSQGGGRTPTSGLLPNPPSEKMPPPDINPLINAVAPMVLPTLGGMAGAAIGGPAGAVGGSLLGEATNQMTGVTEPSMTDLALSAAMPAAGAVAGKAVGALGKRMLRTAAAPVFHELAGEALERIPAKIPIIPEADMLKLRSTFPTLPATATKDDLYNLVNTFNPQIPMPKLQAAYNDLLTTEQRAVANLKMGKPVETGEQLVAKATAGGGGMDFQDVRVNSARIGAAKRQAEENGDRVAAGAYKKLFRAMQEDLESAAASGMPAMPAVQALKAANTAAKREFAVDELEHIMGVEGGGISLATGFPNMSNGGQQVQVNMRRIINNIEKNKDIRLSLGPDEYESMMKDLNAISRNLPALPPGEGVNAGSYRMLRNTGGTAGAGTLIGGALGGPQGAMLGGGAGAAVGAFGPMVLSKLAVTPTGRALLRRTLMQSGGNLSADTLAILGSAVGLTEPGRSLGETGVQIGQGLLGGQPQ